MSLSLAHLALPAILWYCCHHRHKAKSMISFITSVTHQHFVVITWLPTISSATMTISQIQQQKYKSQNIHAKKYKITD